MNIKNNKRRKESIARIENVFFELLKTKELEKISVAEICKLADLNRSTFYANFLDVYDLADKIVEYLESDIMELFAYEREHAIRSFNYLKLFNHIKYNQEYYKVYFKLNKIHIDAVGVDFETAEQKFGMRNLDYHIEFFQHGFNAILKKWLKDGCKESPEEMAQILKDEYNSFERYIESI